MTPFISICITSYKRINELIRCLQSVDASNSGEIEIIVSEDHSPQREAIQSAVANFSEHSPYKVIFNTNEVNLGYDNNLKKLMDLASGQYLMYLSDDDCLFPGALDQVISALKQESPALLFSPFFYGRTKEYRRFYGHSFSIPKGKESASKYVYDSILFSGLTFKRELITEYKADRFKNLNYFQVYLFLSTIYKHGGYYLNVNTINSVSDGENAYGSVDSAGKNNQLLADRESIYSNLEFNKGLVKAIKIFDSDNNETVIDDFSKQYSMRSYGGLSRARQFGVSTYQDYWKKLHQVGIQVGGVANAYHILLLIFGKNISDKIVALPKKMLLNARKQ